jgi:hypothetical protein
VMEIPNARKHTRIHMSGVSWGLLDTNLKQDISVLSFDRASCRNSHIVRGRLAITFKPVSYEFCWVVLIIWRCALLDERNAR